MVSVEQEVGSCLPGHSELGSLRRLLSGVGWGWNHLENFWVGKTQGIVWGFCFIWSSPGERVASKLTWLLEASSSLHSCRIKGRNFSVAVGRRLPLVPCHMALSSGSSQHGSLPARERKSLLVIVNMTIRLNRFNLLHLIEVNCTQEFMLEFSSLWLCSPWQYQCKVS